MSNKRKQNKMENVSVLSKKESIEINGGTVPVPRPIFYLFPKRFIDDRIFDFQLPIRRSKYKR